MSKTFLTIPLRHVTLSQKGVKPAVLKSKPFDESVPYLDINSLTTGNNNEFTFKELGNLATENDVLVVWDGSRSGLALQSRYGIIGSTLMKLTPVGIDTEYLYYFIKSRYEFINGNVTGGGIPHVNSELFFGLEIPYVSLSNQRNIVEDLKIKIDENASILNSQKNAIQSALIGNKVKGSNDKPIAEIIKDFKKAIFESAVSGELTSNWRMAHNVTYPEDSVSLGTVITEIKSGKSFRCLERPPVEDEIGVSKISSVSFDGYKENESKTCIDKEKVNAELFINSGDFLITRANTKELVGACAIVGKVSKKIMLSDKILRISFDRTKVLDQFVLLFLQSTQGREQIENYATGSQESMKNITQAELRSIVLKVPDLAEQKEIIKQAHVLLSTVTKIQNQYNEAIETFEELEKSILQNVFEADNLTKYQNNLMLEKIMENIYDEKSQLEFNRTLENKDRSKAKTIMKKAVTETSKLDIEDVLTQASAQIPAREVWKTSKYSKDIDSFYEAIKHKVAKTITWDLTKLDEEVPESIISLKSKS
ncbi:restriction endonuclease subunit S [Pedobacter insulae]|uniref:Restriction endonuclease S subunit n=1 Tax=Pedobacter insulae TaxID=414048 RepID=A0A1I2Z5X8_9SPHI|nr:restriction endonuclease subunit S [Pedobacter insulae]SFH32979.1 Restriction endonuclease S subunit [Pedobacter insulae]